MAEEKKAAGVEPDDLGDSDRCLVADRESVGILLEALREARKMMMDCGASFHGIYVVPAHTGAVAACFDREFPKLSGFSRDLVSASCRKWFEEATSSLLPRWWGSGLLEGPAARLSELTLAVEATAPVPVHPAGIGLPVLCDSGTRGLIVLAGDDLSVDDDAICDLHIRAFSIFPAIAELRVRQAGASPAMSRREIECLRLTADGRTSEEIAEILGLSVHTANQYLSVTTQKLNAVNRMHAVAKALRMGLID